MLCMCVYTKYYIHTYIMCACICNTCIVSIFCIDRITDRRGMNNDHIHALQFAD